MCSLGQKIHPQPDRVQSHLPGQATGPRICGEHSHAGFLGKTHLTLPQQAWLWQRLGAEGLDLPWEPSMKPSPSPSMGELAMSQFILHRLGLSLYVTVMTVCHWLALGRKQALTQEEKHVFLSHRWISKFKVTQQQQKYSTHSITYHQAWRHESDEMWFQPSES